MKKHLNTISRPHFRIHVCLKCPLVFLIGLFQYVTFMWILLVSGAHKLTKSLASPFIQYSAQRGLLVTPVVAFISDSFQASPNPDEVSEVFSVPVEFFLKETDHSAYTVPNVTGHVHSFIYTDPVTGKIQHIWGLTAFLLILLAVLTFEKKPEFEVGFDLENPVANFRQYLKHRLSKL